MNELATNRFAARELEASVEEKNIRTPLRTVASKSAEVKEWPKDESDDRETSSTTWTREPFLASLPIPAPKVKTDAIAKDSVTPGSPSASHGKPVRIAIKTKGKILLISPTDILAVEAEGNYVSLRRRSDSYLLREPISSLTEKLKEYGFVRIHRSVLVNSAWVEEISPGSTGEYTLRIAGGKQYVVSRTYKSNLKWLAQSWIGTDTFVDE